MRKSQCNPADSSTPCCYLQDKRVVSGTSGIVHVLKPMDVSVVCPARVAGTAPLVQPSPSQRVHRRCCCVDDLCGAPTPSGSEDVYVTLRGELPENPIIQVASSWTRWVPTPVTVDHALISRPVAFRVLLGQGRPGTSTWLCTWACYCHFTTVLPSCVS